VILRQALLAVLEGLAEADEWTGTVEDGYVYLSMPLEDSPELDLSIGAGLVQVRIAG
jgi:hypothetical protein